jgi:hypothetical protein
MATPLFTPSSHLIADPTAIPDGVVGGCAMASEPQRVLPPRLVRALARQAAAEVWAWAGTRNPAPESEP